MVVPAPRTFDDHKVEADRAFLTECLFEVLDDVGLGSLADALRAGDTDAAGRAASTEELTLTYSIMFRLQSLAEQNAAMQRRRHNEAEHGVMDDSALWGRAVQRMLESGLDGQAIASHLADVRVEPVFTAHPTEAKRSSALAHQRALHDLMAANDRTSNTEAEGVELRRAITTRLDLLWRSGEVLLDKPDVDTELRNVVHYLRHVFPDVVDRLDQRLDVAWEAVGLDLRLLSEHGHPRVSFGTWVGGDRDGHPLVTSDVTRRALATLRSEALEVLRDRLDQLGAVLSLSGRLHPAPSDLTDWIARRAADLGSEGASAVARNPHEPWRQAINLVTAGLPAGDGGWYDRASDVDGDLELVEQSLRDVGAHRAADEHVVAVRRFVRTFGFHLAALDIRQNSQFHDTALSQLLAAANVEDGVNYPDWTEERKRSFLDSELRSGRPFAAPGRSDLGHEADAVLDCFRVVRAEIDANGLDGIGSFIVSMTRSPSDLLAVYLFAREVGMLVDGPEGQVCPVRVVPLFETIDDLEASHTILADYLAHPMVGRSLAWQQEFKGHAEPVQQIMVGYSDSNKDGGIVSSLWSVHRALIELSDAARQIGVRPQFFHGRGGTVSRGAGPAHRFARALPAGSVGGDLRLTEQGETIAQKYANPQDATFHLETLLAGTASATLAPFARRYDLEPFMDRFAEAARQRYSELVASPELIEFFSQATPIDVIERSRIGSRPARRSGQRTLRDLRAIPWVFAWSQSRFFLSGWFGLGSGLAAVEAEDPDAAAALVASVFDWPPLHYIVSNSATSFASADPTVMAEYAELVVDDAVRQSILGQIQAEYSVTAGVFERIYEGSLAARRPNVEALLAPRRAGLSVLHRHQIDLLRGLRNGQQDDSGDDQMPLLLATVNAISSGLGTTG